MTFETILEGLLVVAILMVLLASGLLMLGGLRGLMRLDKRPQRRPTDALRQHTHRDHRRHAG